MVLKILEPTFIFHKPGLNNFALESKQPFMLVSNNEGRIPQETPGEPRGHFT
jgi:hypothetical protein